MFDSGSQTIREDSNATIREGQAAATGGAVGVGGSFRGYRVVRQLPSTSTEADIFVVERENVEHILKLYRYGIEPKNDILKSIKTLSEAHPQNFIRVYEADFDKGSNRWFEVQEYAKAGTLQTLLDDRSKLTAAQQSTFFNDVAREVGESLNLLHLNNLLHLDIKPSNILLRSLNPLDMVLIDFGIATSLASDMSKKFTQTRGTPMYQSPESYTGGMGRASDWWGLGMILLEIATGSHPFKGLSANVIAYSVATEPVNIPDNLDDGQRELFHGLLTRNPEKRWNWEQVSRWLKGERGIPQYFEETAMSKSDTAGVKSFGFMGQQCRSLAEIAAAFVKNEEAWDKGKALLMRGNIRTWLEQNGEFEQGEDVERFLSNVSDADEKMFRFAQHFGKNIPFIFGGHQITLQNLFLFAGKALKREKLSLVEQRIADSISDGRLLSYMDVFVENETDIMRALRAALIRFNGKALKGIVPFLDFYINPQKYYCPFIKYGAAPHEVVLQASDLKALPMAIESWRRADADYIIPTDIIKKTQKASSYPEAISQLESMIAGKRLVSRKGLNEKDIEALRPAASLLGSFSEKQRQPDFLDFYLHPEKYYCPFVKDASTVESVVMDSQGLERVPIQLKHFEDVQGIIPEAAHSDMQKADSYHKGLSLLKSEDVLTLALKHDDSKALASLLDISRIAPQSVMMKAARYNAVNALRMLLGHGLNVNAKDNDGVTVLMYAAEGNAVDAFNMLLEHGADANAKDDSGKTVLVHAAEGNAKDILKMLLERGANVNATDSNGVTLLMHTAEGNAVDVFNMLMERGADINAKDNSGKTVLIHAVEGNAVDILMMLLERGANTNTKDGEGKTLLMYAAKKNAVRVIRFLLEYRGTLGFFKRLFTPVPSIDAKDNDGKTALMYAAEGNAADVFNMLLERGADINAKDNSGKTAPMIAAASNAGDIFEVAMKYLPGVSVPKLNSTYSGNYLGDVFTKWQIWTIRAGTFYGMGLGDYWTIDGVNWRIADFDYLIRINKVNKSKHHLMIVPDMNLYEASMNATDTTSDGYAGSEMHTSGLNRAKEMINKVFGTSHILPDYGVELMTKEMIFGDGDRVFSLFRLHGKARTIGEWYWLQDAVSAANFARVNTDGYAYHFNASYSGGVRPAFAVY